MSFLTFSDTGRFITAVPVGHEYAALRRSLAYKCKLCGYILTKEMVRDSGLKAEHVLCPAKEIVHRACASAFKSRYTITNMPGKIVLSESELARREKENSIEGLLELMLEPGGLK